MTLLPIKLFNFFFSPLPSGRFLMTEFWKKSYRITFFIFIEFYNCLLFVNFAASKNIKVCNWTHRQYFIGVGGSLYKKMS